MRYIIGFLLSIGLLIFVFVLIFRGGDSSSPAESVRMVDYANTTTYLQLTEAGPISADQTHREVITTITNTEATIEFLEGYQSNVVRSQSYANNPQAYASFLRALDLAGYTRGDKGDPSEDERGFCPLGKRYVFEIKDGNRVIQRFWDTSCGPGSFRGNTNLVLDLYHRQIPDYGRITTGF